MTSCREYNSLCNVVSGELLGFLRRDSKEGGVPGREALILVSAL